MTAWPTVTLDDVKAPIPRAMTDGPFGSNLTSAHYVDSGPQVVRLGNIGDGVYKEAPAHITWQHFESLRKHEVLPGDLLVASLGETLPRACLMPAHIGTAIVKADCIRVRLSENVDPRWVMYSMQRPQVRKWAEDHLHGVGRPRLGLKIIRQIPIPLPRLGEQQRIVEILEDHLSRLDAADAGTATSARRLVAYQQALRQQAVDAPGSSVVPLARLISRVEAGKSLGGAAPPAGSDEWGIIKVSAMTWGEFRGRENKRIPANRADARYEIRPGDLLVSRANTASYVGASVLVGDVRPRLLLSDKSLRLAPMPGVKAEWLNEVLQSPRVRQQISALATGTKESMRNISQKALLSVSVPNSSEDEQTAVVEAIDQGVGSSRELERALDAARRKSAGLRRSLLAAAFSGRLTGRPSDLDQAEEMSAAMELKAASGVIQEEPLLW